MSVWSSSASSEIATGTSCGRVPFWLRAALGAHVEHRLNRTYSLTTTPKLAIDDFTSRDAGCEKVDCPTVEIDNIDEILVLPCRLAKMLARRVVRIGDRALTIAVIDRVLAPDISLANVDALHLREVTQVFSGEKSSNHALRTIAVTDDFRNALQAIVQIAINLFASVNHIREIGTWNKGYFIAELLLIGNDELLQIAILRAFIMQGEWRVQSRFDRRWDEPS